MMGGGLFLLLGEPGFGEREFGEQGFARENPVSVCLDTVCCLLFTAY